MNDLDFRSWSFFQCSKKGEVRQEKGEGRRENIEVALLLSREFN